jgi:hypothetical protein
MAYPILRNELSMSRSKASTGSPMGAALTLLNGTAHDLNNILSTIVGYCELAQEQAPAVPLSRQHRCGDRSGAGAC